ncbi:DUF397 domain-containing protein [Spirillospora sp. NPDC029432]|uniref:DUF397 domain-containing protein n=1 Tax=Spirillospora sp. NPDC029432 TaxID=3154599 RepID=UPI0034543A69
MDLAGADWRKSSYTTSNGGNCVELADVSAFLAARDGTAWRKASRSGENGGDCVEMAGVGGVVAVRDSKDPGGPVLLLAPATLRAAVQEAAALPGA